MLVIEPIHGGQSGAVKEGVTEKVKSTSKGVSRWSEVGQNDPDLGPMVS